MKKMKYIVMSIVATVVAMAVTSCHQPTDSSTSGLVTVMCDQTFENIIQQEIDVFEYTYPNASVIPYYVDAKSAIDSMIDGRTGADAGAARLLAQRQPFPATHTAHSS